MRADSVGEFLSAVWGHIFSYGPPYGLVDVQVMAAGIIPLGLVMWGAIRLIRFGKKVFGAAR